MADRRGATDRGGARRRQVQAVVARVVRREPAETPGVNEWDRPLDPAHPNPVVLVGGAVVDRWLTWATAGPYLAERGFRPFATNHGGRRPTSLVQGVGAAESSTDELAAFIELVRTRTGAREVDLVGISQGAILALHLPKGRPSIAPTIGRVVALGPPMPSNRPNRLLFARTRRWGEAHARLDEVERVQRILFGQWFNDASPGSAFYARLFEPPVTVPGIDVTVITSAFDRMASATPAEAFVPEPGVRNVLVQDRHPDARTTHGGLVADPRVLDLVVEALRLPRTAGPR